MLGPLFKKAMELKTLAEKAKAFSVKATKKLAVSNSSDRLTEIQRKQLRQGKSANDTILGRYDSESYSRFKESLPTFFAPFGIPDLFLSGEFAKGIKMKISGNNYDFFSTDEKNAKLTAKYPHIWGINATNFEQAQTIVTNEFNNLSKQALGL